MFRPLRSRQKRNNMSEIEKVRLEIKAEELQKEITKIEHKTCAFWLRDQKQVRIRKLEQEFNSF